MPGRACATASWCGCASTPGLGRRGDHAGEMKSDQWQETDVEKRREFYLVTAVLLLLLLLVILWPS